MLSALQKKSFWGVDCLLAAGSSVTIATTTGISLRHSTFTQRQYPWRRMRARVLLPLLVGCARLFGSMSFPKPELLLQVFKKHKHTTVLLQRLQQQPWGLQTVQGTNRRSSGGFIFCTHQKISSPSIFVLFDGLVFLFLFFWLSPSP